MHIASPVVEKAFLSRLSYRCDSASIAASWFFPSIEGKVNFYHLSYIKVHKVTAKVYSLQGISKYIVFTSSAICNGKQNKNKKQQLKKARTKDVSESGFA